MAVTFGTWQGGASNEYSTFGTNITTTDSALVLYFMNVLEEATDAFVEDSDGTKFTEIISNFPSTNAVSIHGRYYDAAGTFDLGIKHTQSPGNVSRGGLPIYGLQSSNLGALTRDTTFSYETGTDSTSSDAINTSPTDVIFINFNAGDTNTVASDNTDWTRVGSQAYSASSIDVWRRTGPGSTYNPGLLHVEAQNRQVVSVSLKSLLGGGSQVIWLASAMLPMLTIPLWLLYNTIKVIL